MKQKNYGRPSFSRECSPPGVDPGFCQGRERRGRHCLTQTAKMIAIAELEIIREEFSKLRILPIDLQIRISENGSFKIVDSEYFMLVQRTDAEILDHEKNGLFRPVELREDPNLIFGLFINGVAQAPLVVNGK